MANTFKFGNGEWAVGKETVLAYNDENNNFKPLPFTFDRASSATVVNKDGLIETVGIDEPRIDFLNDSKGALLLEPSRTNLILSSENISGTGWGRSGWTLTNDFISPDGTNNAYSILRTTGVGVSTTLSLSANTTYTFSAYIKNIDATNIQLRVQNAAGNSSGTESNCVVFQVTDQTNTDDFVRITHTFNTGDAGAYGIFLGYYSAGEYIVWGAQVEQGSYATSYIPTQGQSGGVTRSVDYTKIANSPILQGTNQFTLFFEAKDFLLVNGTNASFGNIMFVLGAGESAYDSGTGIHIYDKTWFYYNGSSASNIGVCYNGLTDSKFAISYDGTKFIRYAGGIKLGEYVISASMVNWDTITTGAMADAQNDERNFNLSDLRLYNTALTDAELIALTT